MKEVPANGSSLQGRHEEERLVGDHAIPKEGLGLVSSTGRMGVWLE